MNRIQQLCAGALVLFVLSLSAVAGTIHTNVVEPPPPPPASAIATESGNNLTDEAPSLDESKTLIAELALGLLQLLTVI